MSSVALESKTKLPHKIMEIITDASALINLPINNSQSADMLLSSAKQLAVLGPVIDNSDDILKKIGNLVDEMESSLPEIDKGIDDVCEIQERIQSIERHNYYSAVPKSVSVDSFSSVATNEKSQS